MHLDIRIQRVGEPVLFPEFAGAYSAELVGMGILEHGMESGKPSVCLVIRDVMGHFHTVQMSADMFEAAAGILRGTRERWKA